MQGAKLAFGTMVYSEPPEQLDWCLANVRRVYPESHIFVIADGKDNPAWREVCRIKNAEYIVSDRMKVRGSGAIWWARFFQKCLEYDASVYFKIDPDTKLHRPFRRVPNIEIFGSAHGKIIQGGIQGFLRRTVERIVASNVCFHPKYKDESTWAIDCMSYLEEKGEVSTDFLLTDIARQLRLRMMNWSEVHSQWKKKTPFRLDVAATHPHKCDETLCGAEF